MIVIHETTQQLLGKTGVIETPIGEVELQVSRQNVYRLIYKGKESNEFTVMDDYEISSRLFDLYTASVIDGILEKLQNKEAFSFNTLHGVIRVKVEQWDWQRQFVLSALGRTFHSPYMEGLDMELDDYVFYLRRVFFYYEQTYKYHRHPVYNDD